MYSPGSNLPVSSQLKTVVDVFVDPDWSNSWAWKKTFSQKPMYLKAHLTTLVLASDSFIEQAANSGNELADFLNQEIVGLSHRSFLFGVQHEDSDLVEGISDSDVDEVQL